MFEALLRRVEAGAEEMTRARTAKIAEAFRAVPGVMVTEDGDVVTARARGMIRRWLDEAALRSIGLGS